MITTTHARPHPHVALRGMLHNQIILCPRCAKPVGSARGGREVQQLLGMHRCTASARDVLQPSTAVPFS